jgi:hypothetical protein
MFQPRLLVNYLTTKMLSATIWLGNKSALSLGGRQQPALLRSPPHGSGKVGKDL